MKMKHALALLFIAICLLLMNGCTNTRSHQPALIATPMADIKSVYQNALQAMQAEQWQPAHEQLTEITTQQPSLSGPWVNLGITRTMLGDHAGAESAFKKAIDTNSRNIEAYNQLGMLYRRHGRLDEAQFIYEEALRRDPDNSNVHWNLGILYDRYLPNPRQALQHYQRFQKLTASDDPRLLAWIAELEVRNPGDNVTAKVKP
ncbi:MAG: tetratricopeptide repeat protein [Gammaproteobacteria bacterium]